LDVLLGISAPCSGQSAAQPWPGRPAAFGTSSNYARTGDLVNPAPVNLWLVVDENPDTISYGWFYQNPSYAGPQASIFSSGPSLLHSGGTTFAFADGHTEIHKWLDPRTYGPNFQTHYTDDYRYVVMPNNQDVAWLLFRMTANADGSPVW
jgi:prepilin-type processing-associated H-X9-DG protein